MKTFQVRIGHSLGTTVHSDKCQHGSGVSRMGGPRWKAVQAEDAKEARATFRLGQDAKARGLPPTRIARCAIEGAWHAWGGLIDSNTSVVSFRTDGTGRSGLE